MKALPSRAKIYIAIHVFATLLIIVQTFSLAGSISLLNIFPFVIFGVLLEMSRFSAVTINDEGFNISAGAAIILAAIILFSPQEVIIYAFIYGIALALFPRLSNLPKALFNLAETINITYVTYLVWNLLSAKNENLLVAGNILPLLVTMFVFVLLDLLAVSTVVALASATPLLKIWKESFDWVLVSYGLIAFFGLILAVVYKLFYIYGLLGLVVPLLLMWYNMYLFSKQKESQVAQLRAFSEMLKSNNEQLILMLAQIIDARDNSLLGHSAMVAKYAVALGGKLGLSPEQIYDLHRSALLHDLGKLGISETILKKPSRLTDEEFNIVKKHTLIGEQLTENIKGMEKVAAIIGQHHEYYNGKGYPRLLKGNEILIESRIVSVCDALDTMLSTRPYKKPWSLEEATKEIIRCNGLQFDPKVVEALLDLQTEAPPGFFANSAQTDEFEVLLKSTTHGAR